MGVVPVGAALLSHVTNVLAPAAAWVVASVFIWSGVAKLHRPERAALALVDFGLLRRPVIGAGVALGVFEIALAFSVMTVHPVGSLIAVGVFFAFAVVVLRSLAAGRRFPCYCFGGSEEISAWSLFRALGLLALALVVTSEPPVRTLGAQLAGATAGVATICVVAVASSAIGLSRASGRRNRA